MQISDALSGLPDPLETWATPLPVRKGHVTAKAKAQRVIPPPTQATPASWLTAPRIGWTAFQEARADALSREPAAKYVSGVPSAWGGPVGSKTKGRPQPAYGGNEGEV